MSGLRCSRESRFPFVDVTFGGLLRTVAVGSLACRRSHPREVRSAVMLCCFSCYNYYHRS